MSTTPTPTDIPAATGDVLGAARSGGLLVAGVLRPARDGATFPVLDPATGAVLGQQAAATPADVDEALEATAAAWARWRRTDPWARSGTLRAVAGAIRERLDGLALLMTEESGKPLGEAAAEWRAAAEQFDWFADETRRLDGRVVESRRDDQRFLVRREPVGPVAALTAWNFPALLPARKVAAALAAGCSVVCKPAEDTPRCGLAIGVLCAEAGIPPATVQMLTGDPAAVSERLVDSGVIRKVSLTGSVPVGRAVAARAGERLLPVTLELGGHSPVLVFADADLPTAADLVVRAKFRNCGQVCISPSRIYVHEHVAGPFTELLVERIRRLRVGDGRDPGTDVGPLVAERRRAAIESLVAEAVGRGARVLTGGRRPPGLDAGVFYEPTLLGDVSDDMAVMREEPFGPVAPVTTFTDLDEVLARANDTPFGLAGYVFTADLRTAFLASEGLEVGMVGVNHLLVATAEAPFGGVKASGWGREGGTEALDAYTVTKLTSISLGRR